MQKHDKDGKGVILPLHFKYILYQTVGLSEEEVDSLTGYLMEGEFVNYRELLKMLQDTTKYFTSILARLPDSRAFYEAVFEQEYGKRSNAPGSKPGDGAKPGAINFLTSIPRSSYY